MLLIEEAESFGTVAGNHISIVLLTVARATITRSFGVNGAEIKKRFYPVITETL